MLHARRGRRYWTGIIREYEASALSQEAFCEGRDLTVSTFRGWLYRLRRESVDAWAHFVDVLGRAACGGNGCSVAFGDVKVSFETLPKPERKKKRSLRLIRTRTHPAANIDALLPWNWEPMPVPAPP